MHLSQGDTPLKEYENDRSDNVEKIFIMKDYDALTSNMEPGNFTLESKMAIPVLYFYSEVNSTSCEHNHQNPLFLIVP